MERPTRAGRRCIPDPRCGGRGGRIPPSPRKDPFASFCGLGQKDVAARAGFKTALSPAGRTYPVCVGITARVCGYGVACRISSELSGKSYLLMPPSPVSAWDPLALCRRTPPRDWERPARAGRRCIPDPRCGGRGGRIPLSPPKRPFCVLLRPWAKGRGRPRQNQNRAIPYQADIPTQHIWEYPARRHHSRRTAPIQCSREKQSRKACR